jgi:hypothetical protein
MRVHCPILLFTNIVLQIENHAAQKFADNHGDNRITEPGSKECTECPSLFSSDDASPPTLQLHRIYFFKKKQFSPKFVECVNLHIPNH